MINSFSDNVSIQHGVNACRSLSQQIGLGDTKMDYVFFNFPHLGVEDCQLHAFMMAHLMSCVKSVMTDDGIFYLSLADDQPLKWRL